MGSPTKLERHYPSVGTTELWQLLKGMASADFLAAVGEVCIHGINLSKEIIDFFPTFTLHDETHIANVCNWMIRLLGPKKEGLSSYAAALLIMSACCHDIGMSVSYDQKMALRENAEGLEWRDFFRCHPDAEIEFNNTGSISDQILRTYIRENHHKRVGEQIDADAWPRELTENGILRETLINLCESHGNPVDNFTPDGTHQNELRLCAVLLRLADILDFDPSRAPADLLTHLGLEHPTDLEAIISKQEWAKNRAGFFGKPCDMALPFTASYGNLDLEMRVRTYLNWVEQELKESAEYLSKYSGPWQALVLPREISTGKSQVERQGYQSGPFCITMDQDRILNLLAGQNLYSDPGAFVRELLQNSIDAVLTRSTLDPNFKKSDGRIVIYSWVDHEGYNCFRIEDNGVGMDENIIIKYFLGIGRSYYTSDDFKAVMSRLPKRRKQNAYTPISRFGIGILSCFMNDPEHNMLEVSTRRYSYDPASPNPAIRLNVTGLHGYYYLAREDRQSASDKFFQRMHHPRNEDKGYRTEVGTTICVRMKLHQLGSYRSVKAIVDKYVQFPEVQVKYCGREGKADYPTLNQLKRAINELKSKEYIHKLPDTVFEKLNKKMSSTTWREKPAIVLQYCPLNELAASNNVNGMAVFAKLQVSAISAPFSYEGETCQPELQSTLTIKPSERQLSLEFWNNIPNDMIEKMERLKKEIVKNLGITKEFEYEVLLDYPECQQNHDWLNYILSRYPVSQEEIHATFRRLQQHQSENIDTLRQYNRLRKSQTVTVSYDDLLGQMDSKEKKIFQYIPDALCRARPQLSPSSNDSNTLTAYNGVLADSSNLFGKNGECMGLVLLLRGKYCPEVNLARNTISHLPLEAACNLAVTQHNLSSFSHFDFPDSESLRPEHFALVPERELCQLLKRHPKWIEQFRYSGSSLKELEMRIQKEHEIKVQDFSKNSLYDHLCLAALKLHFTVCKNTSDASPPYITKGPVNNNAAAFPTSMFFVPQKPDCPFGYFCSFGLINYYNIDHPLSQWLIAHQAQLQKEVPDIYNGLLKAMLLSTGMSELMNMINGTLTWLQSFNGNLFGVSDELFLKSGDLK